MCPKPSRELVLKKLHDCFPDPHQAEEAMAILDTYGTQKWHRERERVQLAILMRSNGQLERLKMVTKVASNDYRDVLRAEYLEEIQASSGKTPPQEMAAIRQRDRARYEAWLDSGGA
jgi:hypothetical protein